MRRQQFYRSKLIFNAMKNAEETRSNTIESNKEAIPYIAIDYENPVPGTSATSSVESDDVALSVLYSSDDSVTDPEYLPPSKKKLKKGFTFDCNDTDFLFENLELPEPTFPIEDLPQIPSFSPTPTGNSILEPTFPAEDLPQIPSFSPPPTGNSILEPTFPTDLPQIPVLSPTPNSSTIFVATYYPNTTIFIDVEQAFRFVAPARFSAMYPGPIYDLNKSDKPSDNDTQSKVVKNKLKYPIMAKTCEAKCRRSCNYLTEKEREDIWNNYWNMSYSSRRQFLNKCVKIEPKKQTTTAIENSNKMHLKKESRYYYFYYMGKEINVCKAYFLQTLGYRTDSVITELSKAVKRKPLFEDVKENRGGKKPLLSRGPIQQHIMSYNPALSHYRRNNAPLTKYLPRTLTLQSMLNDYKSKNPNSKCSLETYRTTMKQMKVSLNFPKGDQCTDCGVFEEKIKNGDETETLKETYESHKKKAEKAIKRYREDGTYKNTATNHTYSMDLQKVTLLPDMPSIKDSVFLSRLIAFNLTFAPIKKDTDIHSKCVVWHEALMGRDANNIVDALVAFLRSERNVKHLILWCDNCAGQNKNWFLFTALVTIVNCQSFDVETITFKYLTKGHTHMSADGVHGNIERDFNRRNGVYDYEDFKDVIAHCRKNINVIEVQQSYQWPKKKRVARRNAKDDPLDNFLLGPLVEAKFTAGSRNLLYKTDFGDPYKELDFLINKFDVSKLPPLTNNIPRGIKSSKKDGIVSKLVPLMPISRREFWLQLPINDRSIDLISDGQITNDE